MIIDPLEMADANITTLEKSLATEKAEHEKAKNKVLMLEDKLQVLEHQLVSYREKFKIALKALEI